MVVVVVVVVTLMYARVTTPREVIYLLQIRLGLRVLLKAVVRLSAAIECLRVIRLNVESLFLSSQHMEAARTCVCACACMSEWGRSGKSDHFAVLDGLLVLAELDVAHAEVEVTGELDLLDLALLRLAEVPHLVKVL